MQKMVDKDMFRKVIDDDLMKLKFVLKNKIASFDEVKKEEEQLIEAIKKVMVQVKEMENILEKEISLFRKFSGGWEKAYLEKRWDAIGSALKNELSDFDEEYAKTKDLYSHCLSLHQRLHKLVTLLKDMNASNRDGREKELQLLENFKRRRAGLS